MKIRTIIIDDEPLAREGMKAYIKQVGYLEFNGAFPNPLNAMRKIEKDKINLIFLDIQLPKINGIQFLKTLKVPPLVVITTAYPDYAIEGFELDVMDYLLKPISFQKFLKAANKVKSFLELKNKAKNGSNFDSGFFFIKTKNTYEKINYDDVLFIEAMQNYVAITTYKKKYITYVTLKGILENLPEARFVKIQKSFVAAISKIDSIEGNTVKIGEHSIPISRDNKNNILKRIMSNKLIKR
ncbi:MAG TPA: LytTR family DNA-binding domain-containing protein [Ignavibacteria bacterium]